MGYWTLAKIIREVDVKNRRSDREINNLYLNTGKVDRVVRKSFEKEATHKLETSSWSNGFITAIMKWIKKLSGFFKKRQPIHAGTSTKSYCQKFGGAFGGSTKGEKSVGSRRLFSRGDKGYVGAKKERRLQKSIVRNGGVIKLKGDR